MRIIDADVLFSILHRRMKTAAAWIASAETDETKARAEGCLSALREVNAYVEDEVITIRGRWTGRGNTFITCSDSGECTEVAGNYCPFCGAKLEGDK